MSRICTKARGAAASGCGCVGRATLVRLQELLTQLLSRPDSTRRLVVVFCVVTTLVAIVVHFPEAFADANRTARANAALDYLDREVGGGNSILPDQAMAIEARGWIPPSGSFRVDVGEPHETWTELATPDALETYMRYFLLPRRPRGDAPWILCFGCDHGAYPGAQVVWEDDEGLSILRRPA